MKFKDIKTDKIITLEEVKERYIRVKKNENIKYTNFQDYLLDQINKYGTIEVI